MNVVGEEEEEEGEVMLLTPSIIFSYIKSEAFISDRGFPSHGITKPATKPYALFGSSSSLSQPAG